ncbi:MAG: peptide ABC transporter substrate-binding protein [Planctomycetota bacterium]
MSRPTFVSCRRLVTSSFLSVAALVAVVGCDDSAEFAGPEINPDAEAEFVFANRGEVTQLDPNQMSWMQDIRIAQGMWEGIYRLDAATLEPVLGVGESVEHSEDFKTWTITLKDNAKWNNGDPVVAGDFIFAWKRHLHEAGYYSYLVEKYIVGAKEYSETYREGGPDMADESMLGMRAIDDRTLEVNLTRPVAFFPDLLTFTVYWPMHEASMEPFKEVDDKGRVTYADNWWQPTADGPVTNGAYKLDRNDQKQGQTLVMNEHYWDAENVKSRTVRSISPIEHNLAFQRYENGLIDWLTDIPGQFAYDMRQSGRDDLLVGPAFGTYFWSFNTDPQLADGTDNPISDVLVRKALSAAVDKQEIVDTIVRMDQMVATTFIPQNANYFDGYNHPTGIDYDVEQAKKWLAEAGYPNGEGFPRLKLFYNTGTGDHEQIAQNLARQWREKLGIEFDLDPVEMAQFKVRYKPEYAETDEMRAIAGDGLRAGEFAISRGSWYGDYMDVTTFTDMFMPDSLNNTPGWVSEEYARLCNEAAQTIDPQARLDLYAQAEQLLIDEAVIMPIYHYVNTFIKNPAVDGIPMNPRNMVMLKAVETPRSTGPGASNGNDGAAADAE